MESLIRKKQKKKGLSQAFSSQSDLGTNLDPFEEIYRYLKQARLRREDCPNPIPWWGVCSFQSLT